MRSERVPNALESYSFQFTYLFMAIGNIILQPDLCLENERQGNQNTGQVGDEWTICQLDSHKSTTSAGLLCTCPLCYASRKGGEGKRRGLEAAKSTERGSTT